jgi:hypothetical protein
VKLNFRYRRFRIQGSEETRPRRHLLSVYSNLSYKPELPKAKKSSLTQPLNFRSRFKRIPSCHPSLHVIRPPMSYTTANSTLGRASISPIPWPPSPNSPLDLAEGTSNTCSTSPVVPYVSPYFFLPQGWRMKKMLGQLRRTKT